MMSGVPRAATPPLAIRGTRIGLVTLILMGASITSCSSGPERNAKTFCAAYIEVAHKGGRLGDPDEVAVSTLRSQVAAIDDAAARAAQRAPDDIATPVKAVIAPLHRLRDDLDDATNRKAATLALRRYRSTTGQLGSRQHELDTWVGAHCGVVPVTTTTTLLAPTTTIPG